MSTKVRKWVQDLVDDVCGPNTIKIGGKYLHPEDGPITVTKGQYWGEYGLSNFWYWTVIATGEEKHGYGGNWKEVNE